MVARQLQRRLGRGLNRRGRRRRRDRHGDLLHRMFRDGLHHRKRRGRGKRTDVSDNLYRVAPLRASINADYATGQWNHRAEWQLAARQDKVSANNSETATGGYGLFNLRTSYRFDKKATLNAGIENLFDRYYADHLGGVNRVSSSVVAVGEHLPGAGRFGYVSADYRW